MRATSCADKPSYTSDKTFSKLAYLGYLSVRKDILAIDEALSRGTYKPSEAKNLEAHALHLLSLTEYYETEVIPYA